MYCIGALWFINCIRVSVGDRCTNALCGALVHQDRVTALGGSTVHIVVCSGVQMPCSTLVGVFLTRRFPEMSLMHSCWTDIL